MENVENRKAQFQSVVAYPSSQPKSPICFKGEAIGEITKEERKRDQKSGFGFDPIFTPAGSHRTFAEMDVAEKNKHSHRAKALRTFAEWYKKLQ